jgi:hypothetical protein
MGALDLLFKAGAKGAKKAAPFFSKADVVLDELQRNKGTGDEFLTEIVKKGAKPTELKERGIEKALKGKPKMTKAEVQKVFQQKAPPKVQEKVLTDVPDYDEWLEAKAQEEYGVDYFDLNKDEKKKLDKMYGDLPATKYEQYKTPGGENYREILLKLPAFDNKRLMELEADIRRSESVYRDPMSMPDFRAKLAELEALKAEQAAAGTPYTSSHYREDPNLLAHIRVQDFISPTYTKQQAEEIGQRIATGMGVADPKNLGSGSIGVAINKGYVTPKEAAQYADFRKFQGVDTTGAKRKVLLVDEVQSDWHQEGRKKGYQSDAKEEYMRQRELENKFDARNITPEENLELENLVRRRQATPLSNRIPDAPFKKNWHELAMKRVLDYAAENGYDTVAITPGAEQAKRYDLSKQIDSVVVSPFRAERGEYTLQAIGKDGKTVIDKNDVQLKDLDDYIGKDLADKARQQMVDFGKSNLTGVDLQVGGEGMKGFYDKILPDYLNNYGKKYGAQMGEIEMVTQPERFDFAKPYAAFRETIPAESMRFHSFDITPQMREEIQTKGQPMYGKVAMPALEGMAAGTGAATMGSQMFDENNEQSVQNPVHFTENPDAMLLELMQRN